MRRQFWCLWWWWWQCEVKEIHIYNRKLADFGLLKFNKDTGRVIIFDALRVQILQKGWKNSDDPFLPSNNQAINKTLSRRKVGNGSSEEIRCSWLLYSPCEKVALCIYCLLFLQSSLQSPLEKKVDSTIKRNQKEYLSLRICQIIVIVLLNEKRNLVEQKGLIDAWSYNQ